MPSEENSNLDPASFQETTIILLAILALIIILILLYPIDHGGTLI